MQNQIERDIKSALLEGDKARTEALRTLKSAILNEAIARGGDRENISDSLAEDVLRREAKRRQEAAELYDKAGEKERAAKELAEKTIIDSYLPEQMPEEELRQLVAKEIAKLASPSQKDTGRIIGQIRSQTGGRADGASIARLVKEELE